MKLNIIGYNNIMATYIFMLTLISILKQPLRKHNIIIGLPNQHEI